MTVLPWGILLGSSCAPCVDLRRWLRCRRDSARDGSPAIEDRIEQISRLFRYSSWAGALLLVVTTGYTHARINPKARCFTVEITGVIGPAFTPAIPMPRSGLRNSQTPKTSWMDMYVSPRSQFCRPHREGPTPAKMIARRMPLE